MITHYIPGIVRGIWIGYKTKYVRRNKYIVTDKIYEEIKQGDVIESDNDWSEKSSWKSKYCQCDLDSKEAQTEQRFGKISSQIEMFHQQFL